MYYVGMLPNKENCNAEAEGFRFRMVILSFSYHNDSVQKYNVKLKTNTTEVTAHCQSYPTIAHTSLMYLCW